MATLTFGQLESLWIQAGGPPAKANVAAAIAEAESGGRSDALNATPPDYSVGPWQINYYGGLLGPRTQQYGSPSTLLKNPLLDAKAAVSISSHGTDFSPWTTFTSGAYLGHLGGANSAGSSGQTSNVPSAGVDAGTTQNASLVSGITGDVTGSIQEAILRLAELFFAAVLLYLGLKALQRALQSTPGYGELARGSGVVGGAAVSGAGAVGGGARVIALGKGDTLGIVNGPIEMMRGNASFSR